MMIALSITVLFITIAVVAPKVITAITDAISGVEEELTEDSKIIQEGLNEVDPLKVAIKTIF